MENKYPKIICSCNNIDCIFCGDYGYPVGFLCMVKEKSLKYDKRKGTFTCNWVSEVS
jgi:hypothetical protein